MVSGVWGYDINGISQIVAIVCLFVCLFFLVLGCFGDVSVTWRSSPQNGTENSRFVDSTTTATGIVCPLGGWLVTSS